MGGSVALASLASGRVSGVDGLILAAPGVRSGVQLHQLHDLALRLGALALPWLRVELRRGGRPWLDPEESRRLAEDPLILRHLSVGTYDGLIELVIARDLVTPARLPPTLLLYGELDRTILRAGIDDLALRLGHCCTLRTYPERHHLLLHERDADEVFGECLQWLRTASQLARAGLRRRSPSVRPTLTVSAPARRSGCSARRPIGRHRRRLINVGAAGSSDRRQRRWAICGGTSIPRSTRGASPSSCGLRDCRGQIDPDVDGSLSASGTTPCAWSHRSGR